MEALVGVLETATLEESYISLEWGWSALSLGWERPEGSMALGVRKARGQLLGPLAKCAPTARV